MNRAVWSFFASPYAAVHGRASYWVPIHQCAAQMAMAQPPRVATHIHIMARKAERLMAWACGNADKLAAPAAIDSQH